MGEIEKQWPQGGMFNPKGGFPLMGQYVKSSSWMVYTFSLPQVFAIELAGGIFGLDFASNPRAAWVLMR